MPTAIRIGRANRVIFPLCQPFIFRLTLALHTGRSDGQGGPGILFSEMIKLQVRSFGTGDIINSGDDPPEVCHIVAKEDRTVGSTWLILF
jgi:hypothetical protein